MHKNPVKSDVLKGGDAYDNSGSDCIVGIGGGAALDVARAIVLRINHRRDLFDYDDLIGGDVYVTNEVPHFVTVPTTSGTGSRWAAAPLFPKTNRTKNGSCFRPNCWPKSYLPIPCSRWICRPS